MLSLLMLACTTSESKKYPLTTVDYKSNFSFKDSLRLNFPNRKDLNGVIIDYKCTARAYQDSFLLEFDHWVGWGNMTFKFNVFNNSIQCNAIRHGCLGASSYEAIVCETTINKKNIQPRERINIHFDAKFAHWKEDSSSIDSSSIISLKGSLWNLIVWEKNVTNEQRGNEYLKNRRREFFEFAETKPEQIKELNLCGVFPDSIPKEITRFKNLKILNVRDHKLRPKDLERIATLKNLEDLDLSNNNLKKFPLPILKLLQLESLALGHNQISELPKGIAQLKRLRNLSLEGNTFSKFPKILKSLKELSYLYLSENKIPKDEMEAELKKMTWLE